MTSCEVSASKHIVFQLYVTFLFSPLHLASLHGLLHGNKPHFQDPVLEWVWHVSLQSNIVWQFCQLERICWDHCHWGPYSKIVIGTQWLHIMQHWWRLNHNPEVGTQKCWEKRGGNLLKRSWVRGFTGRYCYHPLDKWSQLSTGSHLIRNERWRYDDQEIEVVAQLPC